MKPFIIFMILLLMVLFAFGLYMASFSLSIRRQSLEEALKWQQEHYDISWYDSLEKENYVVKSYDGYQLHVQLLRNASDKYVIISHGYTDNHIGSLKYARIYLKMGFNVIIYDLRGYGENEETFCTYSVRESADLNELIKDTRKRYEPSVLGIAGESLGSATSMAVLKYRPEIDFAVADCGFSEITSVMANGLKGMHLPPVLVHVASLCAKLRFGYSYHEMRPVDALEGNDVPILFIHGAEDGFIIPEHSLKMAAATKGYHEVHMIPGADHAASVLTDPQGYENIVRGFLEKIGL